MLKIKDKVRLCKEMLSQLKIKKYHGVIIDVGSHLAPYHYEVKFEDGEVRLMYDCEVNKIR